MAWAKLTAACSAALLSSLFLLRNGSECQVSQFERGQRWFYLLTRIWLLLSEYSLFVYQLRQPTPENPTGKGECQIVLRKTQVEVLHKIAKESPNDGLPALQEPTGVSLLATDTSALADLLVTRAGDYEKPTGLRGSFKLLTFDRLLTVNGDQHKSLRKRSLSHFSFSVVKYLYPLMWRHALRFVKSVETRLEGEVADQDNNSSSSIEISELTTEVTVNVICTTIFGRSYEASDDSAFKPSRELLNFFLQPNFATSIYLTLRKLKAEPQRADLVSHMIGSSHFTDYEIASQLLTSMVAGLLREEVTLALDSSGKSLEEVDVANVLEGLPFLNGFVSETLHLYPSVPRKFDPIGGMKKTVDFLTSLHGPRNCIGQSFAKAELRCLVAALAVHFEWKVDKDVGEIPISGVLTINLEGGLPLRLPALRKAARS
ncbi:hypothetical protein M409DRAFT_65575 [Zasmidium cellare ATCC 36951]|uniref:Cytochrome P450 n=1 Tax=Zasmidium cellare ATCC 36951 TaxID=1080233 RepID=A0A6A6CRA5_ZASCE|nr:uncharacterized protein M409DRAFT_65575 [Zasmidium cellare ATCC 36951]KAF2168016.1 hypothetical protein M409DRAFT_65575 [Zasmidium cellare ATCC 36951]